MCAVREVRDIDRHIAVLIAITSAVPHGLISLGTSATRQGNGRVFDLVIVGSLLDQRFEKRGTTCMY